MNKMQTLAKILLAILGIYIIVHIVPIVMMYMPLLFTNSFGIDSIIGKIMVLLWMLLHTTILLVIVYQLLFRGQFWAEKIVGEQPNELHKQVFLLPAAYRLASVFCGILVAYWVAESMPRVILILHRHNQTGYFAENYEWISILGVLLRLTLGIYLLCGAPHFVRWQVKKTLEICKKTETDNDTLTE